MTGQNTGVGQGDKYAMVKLLLKEEKGLTVEAWIRAGRRRTPRQSYYTLADELNSLFRERYGRDAPRVTWESIRRWDPDGEFQQQARRGRPDAGASAEAGPTEDDDVSAAVPPVQFSGE